MKHIHLLLVAFALSSGSLLAQTTVAVQGSLKKTTDRMPVDFANVLQAESPVLIAGRPHDEATISGMAQEDDSKVHGHAVGRLL